MRSLIYILCLTILPLACGGRSAVTGPDLDGGGVFDGAGGDQSGAAVCTTLESVGTASMEYGDAVKSHPRVVFDGERFSVIWHTQALVVSSSFGDLRLGRVDTRARAERANGVVVTRDDRDTAPALIAAGGKLVLVHAPTDASLRPGVVLQELTTAGKVQRQVPIKGKALSAAVASHGSGYAVLLDQSGANPRILTVSSAGVLSSAANLTTAQIVRSLWLEPYRGGFAASVYSTNHNAALHLFDSSFKPRVTEGVGHGTVVMAPPAFSARKGGWASLYYTMSGSAEVELYDASGRATGHQELAARCAAYTTSTPSLTWTGSQLVAIHSGSTSGQYRVRLLDADGKPGASALLLPRCLASSREISAAWGKRHLAVASINHDPGMSQSSACVAVLRCK
jgi:hypothetical protein